MLTIGIDIGSISTKGVLLNGDIIIAKELTKSGANPKVIAEDLIYRLIEHDGISKKDIGYILATGYGRLSADFADKTITEITCHAKGAFALNRDIRTVIDIGGQDSKVIKVDEFGNVVDFEMNDKCAAGSGRFLEVMAGALEIDLHEMGKISLKSNNPSSISAMCTVFAESEVISLLAKGEKVEDIVAGIHDSITKRILGMVRRLKLEKAVIFCGGVAKNDGMVYSLKKVLKTDLFVPDNPQFAGAYGAAILAREFYNNGKS